MLEAVLLLEQFSFSLLTVKFGPTDSAFGLTVSWFADAAAAAAAANSLFFERRLEDNRLLRGARRMEDLKEPYKEGRKKKIRFVTQTRTNEGGKVIANGNEAILWISTQCGW